MADLSITAASVVKGSNAKTLEVIWGETVTAGQAVYQDPTTRKYMKADNNAGTEVARKPTAIALSGGALNQPGVVQTTGDITIGATLTAGLAYYLSDTPGGICPVADVGSGEYPCLLGMSKSTTVLAIDIQYPGVAL